MKKKEALALTDLPVIDERGREWKVGVSGRYDPRAERYRLDAVLRCGELRGAGEASVPGSVVARFETEGELRAFVIGELRKHLSRTPLADGFTIELSFKFLL